METPGPSKKIKVKTDLAALLGTLLCSLQHTLDIAAFGLIAAKQATRQELQLPNAFFRMAPAPNVVMDFETAKSEFERWVLTGAMRDFVEAVHLFLDEVRKFCFLYSISDQSIITGDTWIKGMDTDTKKYHRLGLPDKIKYLADKYDPSLVPKFADEIISINLARNCLVHRKGIVLKVDLNSEEGLLVRWRKMEIVSTGLNGEYVITKMHRVEAGEKIFIRYAEAKKVFKRKETITFTVDELSELCLTIFFFGNQLKNNLEFFGKSKGVHFNTKKNGDL